jgi:transcriptional regulator with XRE-family HTH domain
MAGHTKWADIKRGRSAALPPEEGRGEGFGLGELRSTIGMSQVDLAKAMQVDQPRVSRIERQDDLYLSTLRDYVRGLGGELDMLVRFPDDRVIWLDPPTIESPSADIVVHERGGRRTVSTERVLDASAGMRVTRTTTRNGRKTKD